VTPSPLDFVPYDNMVGTWIGTFAIFDTRGHCVTAGPSRYLTYWKTRPTLMHFRQDQDLEATALVNALIKKAEDPRLNELLKVGSAGQVIQDLTTPDYDLTIDGKSATGHGLGPTGQPVDVSAAETSPDIYHFELVETGGEARFRWYNTHVFPNQNERRTIGPVVNSKGEIGLIMVHTYTRISYDVPKELQRELPSRS
jgi:hypothetical protein